MSHNDAFGNPLAAGDPVAVTLRGYSDMHKGEVVDFTPKKIVVVVKNNGMVYKYPHQVAKVV